MRTYSAGGHYHAGVWIDTKTSAFNITGNRIGSNSSEGTGMYSINASSFLYIYGVFIRVDTTANSASIQGNTIEKFR
ncbi:MAG: hypothetical protein IPL53_24235 [Ignavibacteria bacterium]|nr:hypothetical protein [Ignavibacteria bacterium]